MTKQYGIVDLLLSFISRQRFDLIPDRVRALAKIHIIDCVGVMLAGAAAPEARALLRCVLCVDSDSPLDILANRRRLTPSLSAYAYAFCARVLDFDDVQTTETSTYGMLTHPTAPVLAAVLAVGHGRNASGETLLSAYLAGVEVATRLAASVDSKSLFNGLAATATFGGIGALMAAAKLLGLRRKEVYSALAIWETTAVRHGSAAEAPLTAALRDAHSVRMAIEAVLLAADGMTVDVRNRPSVASTLPASTLAKNLGKPYYILDPGFAIRTCPSNPLSHPALELMLAIVNLHGLHASDIKRVDLEVTGVMGQVLSFTAPTSISELRRSLPFVIALAACKGVVVPDDFNRLPRQQTVHDLMQRVYCHVNPELDTLGYERARTLIRVTLSSGRVIQMKADVAKGTPQKPLSEIELPHKFLQCALHSLDEGHAEQLLNRLWEFETTRNVSSLFEATATSSTHADHLIHEGRKAPEAGKRKRTRPRPISELPISGG